MAGPAGAEKGACGPRDALTLGALLAALWLSVRPYHGIVHDAWLYTAQALYRLGTPGFEGDLFFRYGSQDSFSAFSLLYAPAVALWGPGLAHLIFAVAGQALWLVSLGVLARSLFGPGWLWPASAGAAIAMVANYGWGVLAYGEPFVTPRIFSEAMTMLALAATLRGRRLAGIALVCAAAALHPLMALPGLLVILALWLPVSRWAVLGGAVALCAVAALALAGVEPFGRALQAYDAEWLAIMHERARYSFVAEWSWRGPLLSALPLLLLSLNAILGLPQHARLARIVLLVSGALVLISWLGGDILNNVLIMNLQPWRGLWILALLGNLLAIQVVLRLPEGGRARVFLALAVAVNVVEGRIGNLPFSSAALGGIGLLALVLEAGRGRGIALWQRLMLDILAVLSLLSLLFSILAAAKGWQEDGEALQTLLRPGIALISLALLVGWGRDRAFRPVLAAAASLVLLVGAVGLADQRTEWARYVEDGAPPDPALAEHVAGQATYWQDGLDLLWFKLKQPSFYSCTQGAGLMFYRATALEFERRLEKLSGIVPDEPALCLHRPGVQADRPVSAEDLASVCRALPELDLIVLRRPVEGAEGTPWRAPAPLGLKTARGDRAVEDDDLFTFHFYSCRDMRRDPAG